MYIYPINLDGIVYRLAIVHLSVIIGLINIFMITVSLVFLYISVLCGISIRLLREILKPLYYILNLFIRLESDF